MGKSKDKTTNNKIVKTSKVAKSLTCIACGIDLEKPRRRYCSDDCKEKIKWVLSLSKGLLRTFNAKYAAFSFTDDHVMLDVLPAWSKVISRFICERTVGGKPAEDLKYLVLQSGKEWHDLIDNKKSKSYASYVLLDKSHNNEIDPASIKPNKKTKPRLSDEEKKCLKILRIEREELCAEEHSVKINSAYRKMAKVHHPDMGGDTEKFKQLNEAHKQMLGWAESPLFVSRKALHNCWSYDASTNRWSPPL